MGWEAQRAGAGQPGEEKAQGDLVSVYKYLGGGYREDGARTRGSGHKEAHRRFPLSTRQHLCAVSG